MKFVMNAENLVNVTQGICHMVVYIPKWCLFFSLGSDTCVDGGKFDVEQSTCATCNPCRSRNL